MDFYKLEKFNLLTGNAKADEIIRNEKDRVNNTIGLIASENYYSPAVAAALASPLGFKYSEGYPRKRYYAGQENIDQCEEFAQENALKAFGLSPEKYHINVQALSGAAANFAAYFALIQPGSTVLGMKLSEGGHLTHGASPSFTGQWFNAIQYGLDPKTGLIDYEEIERLAKKHSPSLIISGASAYSQQIDFEYIGEISRSVEAFHLADVAHYAGLISAGLYPSPFEHADIVTMTTHKTFGGPRGALMFANLSSNVPDHWKDKKNVNTLADVLDRALFPGIQGGPHQNKILAIAVACTEAQSPSYVAEQVQVLKNSRTLAEELKNLGYNLISDGTESHLMLIDLQTKNIGGNEAQDLLEDVNIVVNKNTIPGDIKPWKPSGIRIGTPQVTRRGMKEDEMKIIAYLINKTITKEGPKGEVKSRVLDLCSKFPVL